MTVIRVRVVFAYQNKERGKKMGKITELKYMDNILGIEVTEITVGDFSTRIAQWKDEMFQLSLNTTPKCWLIVTDNDFKSVKEAKKYYLETLKMVVEDTLELLKDIDYTNKK